ncbi:hypothetical protein N2152v2_007171 [Parachlorella kessleri]
MRGTKAISLTIGGLAVNDAPGVPVFEGKYFNVYGSLGRRKGILIMRTVKRIDMDSVEVADYTLFIRGLPEDASKDEANLTVAKRDALSEQLLKLKGELNELEAKIEEDQAKGLDAKETMAAFVTFETEEALAAANALLPHRKLVVGLILVTGLLLISLSIGAALVVARQRADSDISVNTAALAHQMLSVRGAAATLAADLGMGPAQAAALAANDGSMCTALLGVCSTGLSGGVLAVSLSYRQLLALEDIRTMQPAAEGFQAQASGSVDMTDVAEQCADYIETPLTTRVLRAGVVATTVVVNVLLGFLIYYLVKWERYLTRTQEYIMDKHKLLRLCATPTRYSDDMEKGLLGLMPWLAIVHLALAAWMWSYFKVAESGLGDTIINLVYGAAAGNSAGAAISSVAAGSNDTAAASSVNWGANSGNAGEDQRCSLLLQVGIGNVMSMLGLSSSEQLAEEGLPPFSQALAEGRLQGLTTYCLQDNPRYKNLFRSSQSSQDSEAGNGQGSIPDLRHSSMDAIKYQAAWKLPVQQELAR